MERFHPHKKWSKIYVDGVEDRSAQLKARQKQVTEGFPTAAARLIIAKRMAKVIRQKLKLINFSCRKTLENIKEPDPPASWQTHWGTQVMCALCSLPCLSEAITCVTCNSITHYNCIFDPKYHANYNEDMIINNNNNSELSGEDDNEDDDEFDGGSLISSGSLHIGDGGRPSYLCPSCIDISKEEKERFEKIRHELVEERVANAYKKLVAKRLLTFIMQKRYAKKKRALLLLRGVILRRIARRGYDAWQRKKLRVCLIELTQLPAVLQDDTLVVITLIDTIQHSQLFRFDRIGSAALRSPILIPGMTAHMTIVITLCNRRDDASATYVASIQAVFAIRDIRNFTERNEHTIKFTGKVFWVPEALHADDIHVVAPLSSVHMQQSLIDMSRDVSCKILYCPQNVITSVCAMVSAPPLDGLRKAGDRADIASMNRARQPVQQSTNSRTTKWWICLRHLRLYFYSNFGESSYRFCGDMREAILQVNKRNLQLNLMTISYPDGRKWLMNFDVRSDMMRFELAVTESQRALRESGASMFIKSSAMLNSFRDGYATLLI